MSEAASSALMAVASIVISGLLISMFMLSYGGRSEVMAATNKRIDTMDIRNHDDDYLQYSGSTIDGSKLRSIIKSSDNKDVIIEVYTIKSNGSACNMSFDYRTNTFKSNSGGTRNDFYKQDGAGKTISDRILELDSGWYIDPMDQFKCEIEMRNGRIERVMFRRR